MKLMLCPVLHFINDVCTTDIECIKCHNLRNLSPFFGEMKAWIISECNFFLNVAIDCDGPFNYVSVEVHMLVIYLSRIYEYIFLGTLDDISLFPYCTTEILNCIKYYFQNMFGAENGMRSKLYRFYLSCSHQITWRLP